MDQERFKALASEIVDPDRHADHAFAAAQDLHRLCGEIVGAPASPQDPCVDPWRHEVELPTGIALDPESAARCLLDVARTRAFALGVKQAIEAALLRFPERPLRILYAGTGPFATLALLQMPFFRSEDVRFTCLDVHPLSTQSARTLFGALGFEHHVDRFLAVDAAQWEPDPGTSFHLLIVEVMQKALTQEPQVAVTRNLVRFLHPEGLLVPESIRLSLCLLDPAAEFRRMHDPAPGESPPSRIDLGEVARLDRDIPPTQDGRLWESRIRLPEVIARGVDAYVLTHITTYGDIQLNERESGLTYITPAELTDLVDGSELRLYYQESDRPGLRFEIATDVTDSTV